MSATRSGVKVTGSANAGRACAHAAAGDPAAMPAAAPPRANLNMSRRPNIESDTRQEQASGGRASSRTTASITQNLRVWCVPCGKSAIRCDVLQRTKIAPLTRRLATWLSSPPAGANPDRSRSIARRRSSIRRAAMPSSDPQPKRTCLAIVLAAGEGTRMSPPPPRSCTGSAAAACSAHVLATHRAGAASTAVAVVVGPGSEDVGCRGSRRACADVEIFVQHERRRGTAHAVLAARDALAARLRRRSRRSSPTRRSCAAGNAARRCAPRWRTGRRSRRSASRPADPTGYGRLILADGELSGHPRAQGRERSGARACRFCNAGLMALDWRAGACHPRRDRQRQRAERILPDRRGSGRARRGAVGPWRCGPTKARSWASTTASSWRPPKRSCRRGCAGRHAERRHAGRAPETVFLSPTTRVLGRDVLVEPQRRLRPRRHASGTAP